MQAGGECQRGEGVLKNVEKLEQIGKWANGLALPLSGSYLRLWPRALENTREKCRNK